VGTNFQVERTPNWQAVAEALGGDSLAYKMTNSLYRDGLHSLRDLSILQESIGEDQFRRRLRDIRNFGEVGVTRVEQALAAYRLGEINEPANDRFSGLLPEGMQERLHRTLSRYEFNHDDTLVALADTGGVTLGDLRGIWRLLTGSDAGELRK
jgi:hypothetical protein